MKNVIIVLAVVVGITISLIYSANRGQSDGPTEQASSSQTLPAGTAIYDVRTPAEFASGHADGATLLPVTDIERGIYPDIAKDSSIAVYCRSGNRSAQATELLERAGYTNVTDMGGLADIESYRLKLTQG